MAAPTVSQFSPKHCFPTATVTIATDDDLTEAVDLRGTQLVGLHVPSNFDGTGIILFACDTIDGTFLAVQTDSTSATALPITTTASRYVPINPIVTEGLRFVKIGTVTGQTTNNTIFKLACKPRT